MNNDANKLIEQESFKMLLEEFTREQEVHNKSINELIKTVKDLSDKTVQLEEKINNRQPITVHTDTTVMEKIIKNAIANMQIIASTKPQPITKKWQILLFPERDAKLFYKIVFGRWFLWLVMILTLACLYRFAIHWSDNRAQIQITQVQNEQLQKAWNNVYQKADKKTKHAMDKALAR